MNQHTQNTHKHLHTHTHTHTHKQHINKIYPEMKLSIGALAYFTEKYTGREGILKYPKFYNTDKLFIGPKKILKC